MPEHLIRRTTTSCGDVATLKSVAERAFVGAFAGHIPDADMRRYFDTAYSPETLTREVADPDADVFFLEAGGETLGYIKVNVGDAQTEPMGDECAELQRIYLLPEAVGGGYGSALMAKAVDVARAWGRSRMWLGVWDRNETALRFYRAKGFERVGEHWFSTGFSRQLDWILARDI
ncbi:GNAT family N-acetyltransferase [Corynebacterium guangdongense]|uniref:GNAT superfamily N-acetyltransferase n=1 Tax=Corynebacterium guangdongense TaxID=1783348 RepID=A0ABU1ZV01_9CORY|nr:GNAT family N-acetyltransferase [Corynebacterium guangdongense]MDR7328762.1 GNAT superfamily N-acetyltransferase [Corynebacterium guangdongense]WJZ17338.1 Protease synthase and sporulation negative regulatory protein PAI 1 [Corynebacterium guangdongense]